MDLEGILCASCLAGAVPFAGIVSEGEFKLALREYREGLLSGVGDFGGLRLDPYDEDLREALGGMDLTLKRCSYLGGSEIGGSLRKFAKDGGCSLSILFHNIRSAKGPGIELLEAEMRTAGVPWDVVGLAETWLDEQSEKALSLKGFVSICASRKGKTGGGVAVLLREELTYRERPDLSKFLEGVYESVFVEIVRGSGRRNEILGCLYRPPGGDLASFNEQLAQTLGLLRGTDAYLMGDFNVDLLKVSSHGPSADFMEGFTSMGFYPMISLPTRITDTTATLIDNIWTNNVAGRFGSGVLTVRISDHLPVFALVGGTREVSDGSKLKGKRRLINEAKIRRFADELESWSFDEIRAQGVEANVARFRNEFRDMYNSFFPWVDNKGSRKDLEKPWLNNTEFKALVGEKGDLYRAKVKHGLCEEDDRRLVEVTKEVNQMRQRLKREYFDLKLEERVGDLKGTWEVLGEVLRGKKGHHRAPICRYFTKDGIGVTDGKSIAEGFCDFYCQVGPKLAAKIGKARQKTYRDYLGDRVSESLFLCPTTPAEVELLCQALVPGKGVGWDDISPRVIKGVARELSGSLSRLLNCCMREGHYPSCFKVARVVPVFKGEDPTVFSNYRPVSVLPILSQIFERVIQARLVKFLDKHRVIVDGQYGFRAGHSTAMAVLDLVERVRKAWSKGKVALGVLIDLKKAFDTVDHHLLVEKLQHYGVRGAASDLVRSYLENRSQFVTYGGYESDRGEVECGVPQGSVLGPLFFLVYVNDMVKACGSLELVLFADDTNIYAEDTSISGLFSKVNEGLAELSDWFKCNKLTLNLKKTEYIYFGGPKSWRPPLERLEIGGEEIRRVDGARFLGVWVDEGLRWTGQIERVRTKVAQLLGVIGRASSVIGSQNILSLYNGLVLPHLQYCLMVWGDLKSDRNLTLGGSLLRHQKRFAGLVAGVRGRYHADPLFARHKMLKLEDLYKLQLRVYGWKFWNDQLPRGQAALLDKASDIHGHATRSANSGLYIATRDHGSVGYRVPQEWGTLTRELREARSLAAIKRESKREFFSGYAAFKCSSTNCGVCGIEARR